MMKVSAAVIVGACVVVASIIASGQSVGSPDDAARMAPPAAARTAGEGLPLVAAPLPLGPGRQDSDSLDVVFTDTGPVGASEVGGPLDSCHPQDAAFDCLVESVPAVLDLPHGAIVTHADLLWAASDPGQTWRDAQVVGPDGVRRAIAADTDRVLDDGGAQASADITGLVRDLGGGQWRISAVSRVGGQRQWGGWSLVVAYRDPRAAADGVVVIYRGTLRVGVGEEDSVVLNPPLRTASRLGVVRWGLRPDDGGDGLWMVTSSSQAGIVWPISALSTEEALAPGHQAPDGVSVVTLRDLAFPRDGTGGASHLSFRCDAASDGGTFAYTVGAVTLLAHALDQ
jgi:hypothetical protein